MSDMPAEQTITAWARLIRTQNVLLDKTHAALKAAELPPLNWYDVLLELHRAGDGGLRQYEIGDHVLLPKYNLSRLIDRLESEGYVARAACPEDGRGNRVQITPAGEHLVKRMWRVYGTIIHEALEVRLTAAEISMLAQILDKLAPR
jgi:DNA-binding MarR family transcriptional regulator